MTVTSGPAGLPINAVPLRGGSRTDFPTFNKKKPMKNQIWRLALAAASVALFTGSASAIDRVDPAGDFSNVSQRLIITYADSRPRDMVAEARHLSAQGGSTS